MFSSLRNHISKILCFKLLIRNSFWRGANFASPIAEIYPATALVALHKFEQLACVGLKKLFYWIRLKFECFSLVHGFFMNFSWKMCKSICSHTILLGHFTLAYRDEKKSKHRCGFFNNRFHFYFSQNLIEWFF